MSHVCIDINSMLLVRFFTPLKAVEKKYKLGSVTPES